MIDWCLVQHSLPPQKAYDKHERTDAHFEAHFAAWRMSRKTGTLFCVYALDRFLQLNGPRSPLALVKQTTPTNTTSRDSKGLHYYYVKPKGRIAVFDSIRQVALFYGVEVKKFMCQLISICDANRIQVRHPRTNMCGLFCLCFLHHSWRGLFLTKIINKLNFSKHLQINDVILQNFLRTRLHVFSSPAMLAERTEA